MTQLRPYVIQGSKDPVFRCAVACEEVFRCENCGHLLIENYIPEDYVGVGIQCFSCGHLSTTPFDLKGEVFSARVVTLGDVGAYRLESTVTTWPDVTITSDAAYEAALSAMRPGNALPFELSPDGLDAAIALYESVAPGAFALQDRVLARTKESDPLKFPFAWAIRYLRRCFTIGKLNIDRVESRTAFLWLRLFLDAVGSWQHHPRFTSVAKDLAKPDSFLHTVGQLLIAKFLFEHGNPIGLSLEDKWGQPNPDLYIRAAPVGRTYLEVKAPRKLQSVDQIPRDLGFAEGAVKQAIDRSKGQINKSRKGALVIVSTLYDDKSPDLLRGITENWLRAHGRNRTSLACVTIAAAVDTAIYRIGDGIDQPIGLSFSPVLNPHFSGENPIAVDPGRKSWADRVRENMRVQFPSG